MELTESSTLIRHSTRRRNHAQAEEHRNRIAMDDFGSGYSCLSYLPKLPFDELKIDRSFVSELMVSLETRALVQSILTLAHNLGMKVVVEGIETPEQLALIRELGGDEAPGILSGPAWAGSIGQAAQAATFDETCSYRKTGAGRLVSRPYDLLITLGPARAWTPALQLVWRPALHSGDTTIIRSRYYCRIRRIERRESDQALRSISSIFRSSLCPLKSS
jgi:hypothetical protein